MLKKFFHQHLWLNVSGMLAVIFIITFMLLHLAANNQRLNQRLLVGPNPVSPGSTITLTGFEYPAITKVEAFFQSRANGTTSIVTNANGFFNALLTLPKKYITGNSYVYVAWGDQTTEMPLTFARPGLTFSPGSDSTALLALSSTTPSLQGSGFIANEHVDITLDGGLAGRSRVGTAMTDSQGNFTFHLTLPDMPYDNVARLIATDSAQQTASISVHKHPSIRVVPTSGRVMTYITVSGSGFAKKEIVVVKFQGGIVSRVRTDQRGNFKTKFSVPTWGGISPALNAIKALGTESRSLASTSFQVLPTVSLRSNAGVPGQLITATGQQFTPFGTVKVAFVDPSAPTSMVLIPLGSVQASASGTIRLQFTVPRGYPPGTYRILFIDLTTGISVTASFTVL